VPGLILLGILILFLGSLGVSPAGKVTIKAIHVWIGYTIALMNHVVDAASIATSRRRCGAKTDRIDGETLLCAMLAHERGEPRVRYAIST
jgi:hypothetical protein